jgi:hypothetical protein
MWKEEPHCSVDLKGCMHLNESSLVNKLITYIQRGCQARACFQIVGHCLVPWQWQGRAHQSQKVQGCILGHTVTSLYQGTYSGTMSLGL